MNFNALSTPNMFADFCTQECKREVERILHLNRLVVRLLDSSKNVGNLTKLHIYVANAHARLDKPTIQTTSMKRGCGKDLQPCK